MISSFIWYIPAAYLLPLYPDCIQYWIYTVPLISKKGTLPKIICSVIWKLQVTPNSNLEGKGKKVCFQVDFTDESSQTYFTSLNRVKMSSEKSTMWDNLYFLLKLEFQCQSIPISINYCLPELWKVLKKLRERGGVCFVLSQNWNNCLLLFTLNGFFTGFFILSLGCWVSM